jgi:hypothetical protein
MSGQGFRRVAAAIGAILLAGAVPAPTYDFKVDLAFSPKAAARLKGLSEGVVISAGYYGEPTAAAERHADEVGRINLGRVERTVEGAGRVAIRPPAAIGQHLDWIKRRAVRVELNVYSARRSGPDNILDCNFYDHLLTAARRAPVPIRCKLIGE